MVKVFASTEESLLGDWRCLQSNLLLFIIIIIQHHQPHHDHHRRHRHYRQEGLLGDWCSPPLQSLSSGAIYGTNQYR